VRQQPPPTTPSTPTTAATYALPFRSSRPKLHAVAKQAAASADGAAGAASAEGQQQQQPAEQKGFFQRYVRCRRRRATDVDAWQQQRRTRLTLAWSVLVVVYRDRGRVHCDQCHQECHRHGRAPAATTTATKLVTVITQRPIAALLVQPRREGRLYH